MDCGEIEYDVKEAEKYINELHRIIEKAKEEYEYEPPSKYYREGYNTYKRIEEDFEEYVQYHPPTTSVNEAPENLNVRQRRQWHSEVSKALIISVMV